MMRNKVVGVLIYTLSILLMILGVVLLMYAITYAFMSFLGLLRMSMRW